VSSNACSPAGVHAGNPRSYTKTTVVRALDALLAVPSYTTRAGEVGAEVRRENGAMVACEALERLLAARGGTPRDASEPRVRPEVA
jgi:hypothetical protein